MLISFTKKVNLIYTFVVEYPTRSNVRGLKVEDEKEYCTLVSLPCEGELEVLSEYQRSAVVSDDAIYVPALCEEQSEVIQRAIEHDGDFCKVSIGYFFEINWFVENYPEYAPFCRSISKRLKEETLH